MFCYENIVLKETDVKIHYTTRHCESQRVAKHHNTTQQIIVARFLLPFITDQLLSYYNYIILYIAKTLINFSKFITKHYEDEK